MIQHGKYQNKNLSVSHWESNVVLEEEQRMKHKFAFLLTLIARPMHSLLIV
jgi:hypothetical protein